MYKPGDLVSVTCDVFFLRVLACPDDMSEVKSSDISFLIVPVKQEDICLVISHVNKKLFLLTKENIVGYTRVSQNTKKIFKVL
jgi:hypothetical protein